MVHHLASPQVKYSQQLGDLGDNPLVVDRARLIVAIEAYLPGKLAGAHDIHGIGSKVKGKGREQDISHSSPAPRYHQLLFILLYIPCLFLFRF